MGQENSVLKPHGCLEEEMLSIKGDRVLEYMLEYMEWMDQI